MLYTTRKAFTMIELVFIIVVIGILAATALPKLAATRDDAKLAAKAQNIMVAANDISSYAVVHEGIDANLSLMSNSIKNMISRGEAQDVGNYTVNVKVDDISDCIVIKVTGVGGNTETLILEYGAASNSNCDRLRNLIDAQAYPILLHGAHIIY